MSVSICRRCGQHPQARETGWCEHCLDTEDERLARGKGRHRKVAEGDVLAESVARRDRRHRSGWWVTAHDPRRCRECGGVFEPRDSRQRYCSTTCRKRYAYRGAKRKSDRSPSGGRVPSRDPRSRATSLVTNQGSPTSICGRCGASFQPRRSDQRFCSNACRQAAYRDRRRTDEAAS